MRTNCLDCLDRTNVFQTKVCVRMFEELLRSEHCITDIRNLMIQMWSFSGDFISKLYAGTNAVLQTLLSQQKQTFFDRINQGVTSVKRFLKQNLSDEFKQECFMILSGQHSLCNAVVPSVVIQEFDRTSAGCTERTSIKIVTLNCAGK